MFGQSVVVRGATKAALLGMGVDPVVATLGASIAGWTSAHFTLDHHNQAVAEVADHAHTASLLFCGDVDHDASFEAPDGQVHDGKAIYVDNNNNAYLTNSQSEINAGNNPVDVKDLKQVTPPPAK